VNPKRRFRTTTSKHHEITAAWNAECINIPFHMKAFEYLKTRVRPARAAARSAEGAPVAATPVA